MHMHQGHAGDNGRHDRAQVAVALLKKEEVAEGTMAFYFEKPVGASFRAGQHLNMTLIDPPETDAEGNGRSFSLASAPSETNLMIATRMRDTAFKRVLKNMEIGSSVLVAPPHGSFTLHADAMKPAVFLTGGIGITPVLSIVKDAAERKLPHQLILLYSNRRPEDAAFLTELMELAKKNPHFTFVPTMTDLEHSAQSWEGETGIIDRAMLAKYISDLKTSFYYLAGPPGMVAAMRKLLEGSGVSDDSIRTEEFSGY
jgi:ferredoxin-NADP reductase